MVIAAPAISWRVFNGYAAGNHARVAKPVGCACRWKPSNRASEHETRRSRFETRSRHLNPPIPILPILKIAVKPCHEPYTAGIRLCSVAPS